MILFTTFFLLKQWLYSKIQLHPWNMTFIRYFLIFLTPIFDISLALRLQNPHASLQRSHLTDDQTVCSVIFFRNMSVFWHTGVLHVSEPKEVQISNDHRHQNHSLQSFFVMIENSFSLSHKKHSHKIRGRGKSQGGAELQLRLCCEWRTAPVTAGLCSSQAWRGTFPCGAASPPRTSVLLQTQRKAGSLITLISSHHKNPLARFLPSCCLTSPWWM